MTFAQLNMNQTLLKAISVSGYNEPTAIQAEAIPHILEGKDVLGSAQTGTGKTAAFALPIIQRMQERQAIARRKHPRALVLAPTRELALQIKDNFQLYAQHSGIKTAAIFGGVAKYNQIKTIKRGVDVIVATPGRLLDLVAMKIINLDTIEYYVLDEADRMLDMGFIPDVEKITGMLPIARQTMLFSATLPKSIVDLSKALLNNPIRITIAKDNTPLETIDQSVFYIHKNDKQSLLRDVLLDHSLTSALVFVRTKHGANQLTKAMQHAGIDADAIHGNKTQAQRQQALNRFKQRKTRVLIATDVASRGIDIDNLSHVINYDMPETADTYVHRIGRTARAGRLGRSMSFCSVEETHLVKAIQSHIGMRIPVDATHGYAMPKSKPSRQKSAHSFSKEPQTPTWKRRRKHGTKRHSRKNTMASKPRHSW